MISICILLGGGILFYTKFAKKKPPKENNLSAMTANEFINVKDIHGKFLYTRDNMVMAYLKISPISIDLFSKTEKKQLIRQMTASLSGINYPFQLLAVSRPVDISPLLSELSDTLTSSGNVHQKELLRQEILEMSTFALSGDVVERQFFIQVWDKQQEDVERELLQRLKYMESYFNDVGIRSEILEQQDIVRLCNLVNNPAYVHLEDTDFMPTIPMFER